MFFCMFVDGTVPYSSNLLAVFILFCLRDYRDVFKLVESCVCDRPLTAQEKQARTIYQHTLRRSL